jgi:uncharacterized protein (DUF305 family)
MKCNILKNKSINNKDFLEIMILHHQVAVEMSEIINKLSNNIIILEKARNIIFNQSIEINYMKMLYNEIDEINKIDEVNKIDEINIPNKPFKNTFELEYPIIFKNLKCDDSHFNLNHHNNHNMTDLQYVKHMISHHNTALELSKLVIVSTKNSQILTLAQIINLNQSKEMFELYFLEKSLSTYTKNKN